jgi:hypothetical protein
MRNFMLRLENFAPRSGLYSVWGFVGESRQAYLVCRWIDRNAEDHPSQEGADEIDCDEARESCLGITLQFG